jgi:hypothetical protein
MICAILLCVPGKGLLKHYEVLIELALNQVHRTVELYGEIRLNFMSISLEAIRWTFLITTTLTTYDAHLPIHFSSLHLEPEND